MRVLICIGNSLGAGGKERQVEELAKGLIRRTDIECFIISLDREVFYLDELAGLAIPVEFGFRRMRWDLGVFWRLYRAIRRYRPQLIHTLDMMSSFYCLSIARLLRIPLINASIQNAFPGGGVRWKLERLLLKVSDYRVANSYAGLHSRGFTEKERKNIVIVNGFDFSRVERSFTNENSYLHVRAGKTKTVGMVTGFSRYKDSRPFIRAARELNRRRKEVVFVTVGDGDALEAGRFSSVRGSCKPDSLSADVPKFALRGPASCGRSHRGVRFHSFVVARLIPRPVAGSGRPPVYSGREKNLTRVLRLGGRISNAPLLPWRATFST